MKTRNILFFLAVPLILFSLFSCDPRIFWPASGKPTISPAAGSYPPGIVIARLASATSGDIIHYTTDGTEPGETSTVYTDTGIAVNASTVIKAIAISDTTKASEILETSYVIQDKGGTLWGKFLAGGAYYPATVASVLNQVDISLYGIFSADAAEKETLLDPANYLFYYDKVTGDFALTGIPSDTAIHIDAGFKKSSASVKGTVAGDLIVQSQKFNAISLDALAAHARKEIKVVATPVLHVTSPVDNAVPVFVGHDLADAPVRTSPVHFAWDAVPGATKYHYEIMEWSAGWTWIRDVLKADTADTQVDLALTPSAPGHFFNIYVNAQNGNYTYTDPDDWWGGLLAYDEYASPDGGYPHFCINFRVE